MFFVVEKVHNIYETQYVYLTSIFLLSCLLNLHEKCIWVHTLTSDYFTLMCDDLFYEDMCYGKLWGGIELILHFCVLGIAL